VKQNPEAVAGLTAEVAMSIIRILESLCSGENAEWDQVLVLLRKYGLAAYLSNLMLFLTV
jgi:hypothetical protein